MELWAKHKMETLSESRNATDLVLVEKDKEVTLDKGSQ